MELRVLQYFLAAAREGSITRAAQSLHLTQPTLSRQLAQLEEELGTALFVRGPHSITLTPEGLLLKRYAQQMLALAEKAQQDLRCGQGELSGKITIGSGEFASSRILAQLIAAFRARHPQVRYELYSGNSENIRDNLERGLLDLGLVAEPIDPQRYEVLPVPMQEHWALLVREDSPLAQKPYICPQDLAGQPLLLPSNARLWALVRPWLGDAAREEDIIATGNLLYNLAALVQQGLGAALTTDFHCRYDGLCYVPLQPPLATRTALAWKKDTAFSPAAAQFLRFAAEYLRKEEGTGER